MANVILIIICIISLLFFLVLSLTYVKQIRIKDSHIQTLQKSLTNLEAKMKKKDRREAFRLQLLDYHCTFEIIDVGDKLLERIKGKKGEGKIKDISRSGLKLNCEYDLPVRKQIFLQLHFILEDEEFLIEGKIVRKEELPNDIIYGIQFTETDTKEIQRLSTLLHKMEIKKKKWQIDD